MLRRMTTLLAAVLLALTGTAALAGGASASNPPSSVTVRAEPVTAESDTHLFNAVIVSTRAPVRWCTESTCDREMYLSRGTPVSVYSTKTNRFGNLWYRVHPTESLWIYSGHARRT